MARKFFFISIFLKNLSHDRELEFVRCFSISVVDKMAFSFHDLLK